MKIILGLLMSMSVAGLAHAEEKTCAVKGMHCTECAMTVKSKVCAGGKYSTCDVRVVSSKKQLGEMHLVTKDQKQKIDEPAISAIIKDVGYTLDKCSNSKPDNGKAS